MSVRINSSALALCLLLGAALPAATAHAETARHSSCQASKKGKPKAARPARGSSKSKSSSQSTSSAPASSESESESDESDDLSGLDEVAPAPIKQPEPAASKPRPSAPAPEPARAPTPAREEEEDEETASEPPTEASASEDEPEVAPAPENAAEEGESGPSIRIEPYAGAGISTRSVRMPSKDGVLEVAPGVTPAAEVGLRVQLRPSADFSFFAHLIYQSALGFSVTERPPLALAKEVRARSERVSLELGPRWRFGAGRQELAIPVGATVRTLWAEVHTSLTPSYSLVGPHARVELRLAFTDMISLRFGPDVQYIMMVDKDLITAGLSSQGVALGGDASVEAQVSEVWSFRVTFRESHALLAAVRGTVSFQDVERYLTLRAVGSF